MSKILIVEDDRTLCKLYQDRLQKEGFETQVAYDGQEGLSRIKTFVPDLILLDILLPVIDGFEFLEKMRDYAEGRDIPVVVCSNLNQDFNIERALRLGARDFFNKADISLQDLIIKARQYIK